MAPEAVTIGMIRESILLLQDFVQRVNNPAVTLSFTEWFLSVLQSEDEPSIIKFNIKFISLRTVLPQHSKSIDELRLHLIDRYACLQANKYKLQRCDCNSNEPGIIKRINRSKYIIRPDVNEKGLETHLRDCQYSWDNIETVESQLQGIIYSYYTQN